MEDSAGERTCGVRTLGLLVLHAPAPCRSLSSSDTGDSAVVEDPFDPCLGRVCIRPAAHCQRCWNRCGHVCKTPTLAQYVRHHTQALKHCQQSYSIVPPVGLCCCIRALLGGTPSGQGSEAVLEDVCEDTLGASKVLSSSDGEVPCSAFAGRPCHSMFASAALCMCNRPLPISAHTQLGSAYPRKLTAKVRGTIQGSGAPSPAAPSKAAFLAERHHSKVSRCYFLQERAQRNLPAALRLLRTHP